MEDEEFYHLMTADLERLHRVHHHVDPLQPPPQSVATHCLRPSPPPSRP
jgi:hypothetical protein